MAELTAEGLNDSQIARLTMIPRSTVRDWRGPPSHRPRWPRPPEIDLSALPKSDYSYLLGFYLGDGTISTGRRGVYRLRITSDVRYPAIIADCAVAMGAVMPNNRVAVQKLPIGAVEINASAKAWPLLFCETCDQLGIECTWSKSKTVSIARRHSVALLDSFVGPKA